MVTRWLEVVSADVPRQIMASSADHFLVGWRARAQWVAATGTLLAAIKEPAAGSPHTPLAVVPTGSFNRPNSQPSPSMLHLLIDKQRLVRLFIHHVTVRDR